jgi:hypothetical protein
MGQNCHYILVRGCPLSDEAVGPLSQQHKHLRGATPAEPTDNPPALLPKLGKRDPVVRKTSSWRVIDAYSRPVRISWGLFDDQPVGRSFVTDPCLSVSIPCRVVLGKQGASLAVNISAQGGYGRKAGMSANI